MIPKQYRLSLAGKRPFVGQKRAESWLIVIRRPADTPRWAVRVSKKVDHHAVVRNRLRRQLSFWLFNRVTTLPPAEMLIIVRRRPQSETDYQSLYCNLKHALSLI